MLTAHQRLAIKVRLPEVRDVVCFEQSHLFVPAMIKLILSEDTEIMIYGPGLSKAARSHPAGDYSDRTKDVPISPEMRVRLEAVFGRLQFRGDPS